MKVVLIDNIYIAFYPSRLIFISTLDGKLTALNTANGGTEAWELSTEPGALLSSNIDQLEVNNMYK